MALTQRETLENGTPVYLSAEHRFGTDALLLARFCKVHRADAAADLGTGCGIVALMWHDAGHRGPCYAVDLAENAVALVQNAVQCAQAQHITPVCADLKVWRAPALLDVVACNPPYFTGGFVSENAARAAARHETACTVADVCTAAAAMLRDGGRLCLCNRPARLADTICAMRAARIEPKRLQMVASGAASEPWLFLIEGQKNRAPGLRVLPLYTLDGKTEKFS